MGTSSKRKHWILVAALGVLAVLAAAPAAAQDLSGRCRRSSKRCTDDAQCCAGLICGETGRCRIGCRIGGTIYQAGAAHPLDPCLVCRPEVSTREWTPAPDGTACDDGDVCTTLDACVAGTCTGGPARDCDDGVECTFDSCLSPGGCLHTPQAAGCDDHDICTTDACDPSTGCTHTPVAEGGACDLWGANGPVLALALSGNTLYVAGYFSRIGPSTGPLAALDGVTGAPSAPFPRVHGVVYTLAPDGLGGWFVGGQFDRIGNQARANLAHVLADGSVAAWEADCDGAVYRLALHGGTVYAGGYFTTIGGQDRFNLAAIDAVTGQVADWDPRPDQYVIELVATDDAVYAGGYFTNIGGQERHYLAALDPVTGQATSWDPNPDDFVGVILVEGRTVYVGGNFSAIGGQTRRFLAAVDAITGVPTSWSPDPDGEVLSLVSSGNVLFAGGYFSHIGVWVRRNLAAFDTVTGQLRNWSPSPNGAVYALALAGNTIYAGGYFSQIGVQQRASLAAIDITTGLTTSWDPEPDGVVYALGVSNGKVCVGGSFASIGAAARHYLAAIDVGTGRPTAWRPDPNQPVKALVVSDGTLYAGGDFTAIAGQSRSRLGAFATGTGLLTAWNPGANGAVDVLAASGGAVYAAGSFSFIGGASRSRLAALDEATGQATAWNPGSVQGSVNALAVSGGSVFVAGSFTAIGLQFRNFLAAFDATTGQVTSWDPYASAAASALVADGGAIYAGGSFVNVGDAVRQRIAAIDARSGEVIGWDPGASGTVGALAVQGSVVYAAGSFDRIGGQARAGLAALDTSSGRALDWSPAVGGNVAALTAGAGKVFVGGSFASGDEQSAGNIAAFRSAANVPCGSGGTTVGGPSGAPGAPSIPFPLQGGRTCSASLDLSWTAAAGAESYDVFVDGRLVCGNVTGTSCPPGALAEGAHSWYVTARNPCGATSGPTWSFTQSDPPEAAADPNPPGQEPVCQGQVLSWSSPPGLSVPMAGAQSAGGANAAPRGEPLESEESENGEGEDDSARKARDLYLKKREPEPGAGISMQDYLTALEKMKGMRQYSTALGRFLPPRAEANASLFANAGPWRSLGPGNVGGRTRALVIDPTNPDVIYAGAVAGGVWRTDDGGATWAPLNDLMANLAVTCLVLDPADSRVIYAGTGEGDVGDGVSGAGIFRSSDGGATWTQLPATITWEFVNRLAIDPTNSNVLLAATSSGIFRTQDRGASWAMVLGNDVVKDVDFHPTDGTKAVAGGFFGNIWYSVNGGRNWTAVTVLPANAGRIEIAYAPSNPEIVYVSANRNQGEVWRSTDGGHSFTIVNTGAQLLAGQGWYDNALWVDPVNSNVLFVGGVFLWRSTNGGAGFIPADSSHVDNHVIVAHPGYNGTTNKIIYLGNDGGIHRLADAYAAAPFIRWEELNNRYAVTQFYAGNPYPDGTTYFGGTQDNGTVRGSDAEGHDGWSRIYCCDGGYVAVDPTNTDILYAEYQGGHLLKSTNGGITFLPATAGITGYSLFIAPFVMDPGDPQVLWTGGEFLWRTDNGAAQWRRSAAQLGGFVSALSVAPTDGNRVMVGTDVGYVYTTQQGLSADATTVWPGVFPRFGYVSWVAFDPRDPNVAYATYSPFHGAHVWRTRNGGLTWRPLEGTAPNNLPDIPVHTIVVDPDDSATLYIGTDLGVFVSKDAGVSWNVENGGFANVVTESLSVVSPGGKGMLFAFTHGRGAFEVDLTSHAAPLYDVYVDGVLKCRHTTAASCDPGVLAEGPHSWYVVAEGTCGSTTGPTWTFTQTTPAPSFSGVSSATAATECGTVDLFWAPAEGRCANGAITYNVYRSTDANFLPDPSNRIASGISIPPYHDTLLVPGTTYYYIVRAVEMGVVEDSNTVRRSAEPVLGADDRPPTFAGLGAQSGAPGSGCGEIVLSWAPAVETCSNPVRYRVYRSTDGTFEPDPATFTAETTSTSYTDIGRTPSVTYYYIVRAVDAAGNEDGNVQRAAATAAAIPRTLYHQDFESGAAGWGLGEPNNAASGTWELGDPVGTDAQPEDDATPGSGAICWATGLAGGGLDANDVDDGVTTLVSPIVDLSGVNDPRLSYQRWYSNDRGSDPGSDTLLVQVSSDGGGSWSELDSTSTPTGGWQLRQVRLADFTTITAQMRFLFLAQDQPGAPSVVEAAIDDVDVTGPDAGCTGCPAVMPVGTIYVHRSGNDIVLSWETDPASSPRYVAYRVSEPAFDLPIRLGSTSARSYVHEGAAALPGAIFYFVSAVNACGQESAIDTEP